MTEQDPPRRIVYDLGAHNGSNIPYYLLKADLVVAVEANPVLCQQIQARFSDAIAAGQLVVENCVLSVERSPQTVPFFIHNVHDFLSQFPPPDASILDQFDPVDLPAKTILDLIEQYGDPYYIKIDIEHYDQVILRHLFEHQIFPPYLSAESHSIEVFCLFVALGNYEAFKLVDGETVATKYFDYPILTQTGSQLYSFPYHSAGPFGNDIRGDWMTKDNFARLLMFAELGWKDIHVSRCDRPNPDYAPNPQFLIQVSIDF